MPSQLDSKLHVCEHCKTKWIPGNYNIKLCPEIKCGKKIRKILRKEKETKTMTLIERKLAALVHHGNKLVRD